MKTSDLFKKIKTMFKPNGDVMIPTIDESDPDNQKTETALNFNILQYCDWIGRKSAFKTLVKYHTEPYLLNIKLNDLSQFSQLIYDGYAAFSVSYHNDVHALDTMQMTSTILRDGLS